MFSLQHLSFTRPVPPPRVLLTPAETRRTNAFWCENALRAIRHSRLQRFHEETAPGDGTVKRGGCSGRGFVTWRSLRSRSVPAPVPPLLPSGPGPPQPSASARRPFPAARGAEGEGGARGTRPAARALPHSPPAPPRAQRPAGGGAKGGRGPQHAPSPALGPRPPPRARSLLHKAGGKGGEGRAPLLPAPAREGRGRARGARARGREGARRLAGGRGGSAFNGRCAPGPGQSKTKAAAAGAGARAELTARHGTARCLGRPSALSAAHARPAPVYDPLRWPSPRRYLRGEGIRRVPPPSLDPRSLFFGEGPARSSRCLPRKDRGSRLPSYPWPLRERGPGAARSPSWERSRRGAAVVTVSLLSFVWKVPHTLQNNNGFCLHIPVFLLSASSAKL